ncbi:MAG: hypothetical protein P4L46_24165 [Fimbriimonas sp.]|nr:hypothetical protein [Fimbriimonas sp.]
MERLNSEGILRYQLTVALKDRRQVLEARKVDTCMLCRRRGVSPCGLCEICYSGLEGEEFRLANKWLSGVGP